MAFADRTITGVIWSFADQLGRRGISVIVTLLLARFLTPEDFGIMAMMAVFIAIANSLMDSGFKQALIRKQDADQKDFNTAFFANLLLASVAYLILYLAAPWVADFYNETRLVLLIRVSGIVVFINAFQIIQSAMLSRKIDFKAQLKAVFPATLISGSVAVLLAYFGFGVWALVSQIIISSLLITLFLWAMELWRPTRTYSISALREMYSFGYKLFISGLIELIFKNLYIIVIAKFFSTTVAGHYFFVDKIRELAITQLVMAVQMVTYPALSNFQDDKKRLKNGYRKIIQLTTFICFPIILFIAALAEPFFIIAFPGEWYVAHSYLQILCLASLMLPLHSINLNILRVTGRSDILLGLQVAKKTVLVIFLVVGFQFGIYGILFAQVAQSIVVYYPNKYYSEKLIGYTSAEQFEDFLPQLLIAALVAWAIYYFYPITGIEDVFYIPLAVTSGLLMYLGISYVFHLKPMALAQEIMLKRLLGRIAG